MTILVERIFRSKSLKLNVNPERAGERQGEPIHSSTSRDYQDKTNFRTLEWRDIGANYFWNTQENLLCSTEIFSSSCFYE